ncbi:MAG: hypothetical protein CL917_08885 [Deltaproteobacteria bacterium]|nr:hypothetical protein [Deltaproteobacteria bacterium]
MTPYIATTLNAAFLIVLGAWGYLGSDTPSPTALLPVGFGVVLLLASPGVKRHNKVVAHISVLFTLLILLGLFMPLRGAIGRGDALAIMRVSVMALSTLFALVVFIQSFIQARRDRDA